MLWGALPRTTVNDCGEAAIVAVFMLTDVAPGMTSSASAEEAKEAAPIAIVTGAATVNVSTEELIDPLLIEIVASPGCTVRIGAVATDDTTLIEI